MVAGHQQSATECYREAVAVGLRAAAVLWSAPSATACRQGATQMQRLPRGRPVAAADPTFAFSFVSVTLPPAQQVPDLQRLVPPVAPVRQASGAARLPGAPPGDWNWTCPNCHISNPGQRAECSRCRFDNPVLLRQPPVAAANHKVGRAVRGGMKGGTAEGGTSVALPPVLCGLVRA